MGKRKVSKYGVGSDFLVVLGIVLLIFGVVVLSISQSALGDYDNRNSENRKSEERKNKFSDKKESVVVTIVPTVQPTPTKMQEPTIAPIPSIPTPSTPTPMTNQVSQVSLPVIDQPEIQTIPLSGKSVVNLQVETRSVTKTKERGSFLDTIKTEIDSISGGKTTSPTTTLVPTPTTKQPEIKKEPQLLLSQMKLKYQISGGQMSLIVQDKIGKTISLDDIQLREIESLALNRLEKEGITLNLTTENQLAIIDNKVTAITDLPILVDIGSRSLLVSTSDGPVPIICLPDKALKNIIKLGIVANVNSKVVPRIEYSGGELIYKFEATKVYKVLGRFSVTAPVTISVSASSGDVVFRDQTFVTRAVSLISL